MILRPGTRLLDNTDANMSRERTTNNNIITFYDSSLTSDYVTDCQQIKPLVMSVLLFIIVVWKHL